MVDADLVRAESTASEQSPSVKQFKSRAKPDLRFPSSQTTSLLVIYHGELTLRFTRNLLMNIHRCFGYHIQTIMNLDVFEQVTG